MSKKKVVTIITKLELGGAQQVALHTLQMLPKDKYDCFLIAGSGGLLDDQARQIQDVDVQLWQSFKHPISPFSDLISFFKMRSFLKKNQIDLVHTHSSKAGLLGRLAARSAGVPTIIHTIHGWPFHEYQPSWLRRIYVLLEKIAATVTTTMVAVSEATKEKGLAHGIGNEKNYTVIHPASDLKDYGPGIVDDHHWLRQEMGFDGSPPVIGMVACLKPQKAPEDFVRAAKVVLDKKPEVRFVLVGDGSQRKSVEALIRQLELKDKFILTGWRQDIPLIMRGLTMLSLSSLWEGLPCVFAQAMKTGLPIVATDVEGASEAIESGVTGFLVPKKDYKALGEAILSILNDNKMRIQMGKEAMKRVQLFTLETMLEKVNQLYELFDKKREN